MLLTRLCLVMYATPRMLKLLLFCLWLSRIVVPFDRSILIVLKIGLFVNCVSAKLAQTLFLGSTSSQSATSTSTTAAATNATDTATSSARESAEAPEKAPEKYPAFLLLLVIVFNACHVHL